jgi:hypothetical protein
MGKSELQTALSSWNKRAAKYANSGVPTSIYLPIAQNDFQKTFTNDAQPMTNLEADLAVMSAWQGSQGQPPVMQQQPRHNKGGILGDIGTVVSNIVPDAENIITGLPRGLYDVGKSLVNPKSYKQDAKVFGQVLGGHVKGGLGGDLRALAGAPLLGLIPGLSDAAALTTSQGRESLLEHPITAIADVAPYTRGLTKLGAAGATVGLSDADRASLASSPTALAAAAAGRPILFGLRAADRSLFTKAALNGFMGSDIERLAGRAAAAGEDPYFAARGLQPGDSLGLGQYFARRAASRGSFDSLQISTAVSRQTGEAYRLSDTYKARLNDIYAPIYAEGGTRGLATFSRKLRLGDRSNLTAAQQAALPAILQIGDEIRDRGLESKDLAQVDIEGYDATYSADSAVAKNFSRIQTTRDQKQAAQDALDTELAAHPTGLPTGRTPKGRVGIEAAGGTPITTTTRHAHATTKAAVDRVSRATAKHANALKRYQKSYIKNPPPVLQPAIKEKLRDYVARDTRARYNVAADQPTEAEARQLYTQGKMDEFTQAIKTIRNTQSLGQLKQYLGDKEFKAVFQDIVQSTLKEAREGFSPVYFHDIPSHELEKGSTFSLQVVKDRGRDVTEGAYQEKMFGIATGTVFNIHAGQVRAGMDSIERDGMTNLHEAYLKPLTQSYNSLEAFYFKIAEQTFHKRTQQDLGDYAKALMEKEWTGYEFSNGGFKWNIKNPKPSTAYLPRDVARNLQSFAKDTNRLFSNPVYRTGMKIFRTSVLYGPRHFAHIVIGGLFPIAMAEPTAFLELAKSWPHWSALMHGTQDEKITALPGLFKHPANWTMDDVLQMHVGYKYGNILKQYWQKTGVRLSDGMKRFEDSAQTMYQYAVYAKQIKRGADPTAALEIARKMVVNLDSMTPFERSIMKQVMPFYSFTRFALQYLLHFPMDHPLRYSILTQIGSQTAQEWNNSGLPMDMMSLIYFGKPSKSGNQYTINYRNINPFRSVFNVFSFGGFLSSLNPAISSAFAFTGGDVLSGTGQLYPKMALNSQTGGVAASRPAGDFLGAAEQFMPELSWPDLWLGISSNIRKSDPQAFNRALWNAANLPFTPSNYNIPVERGKEAASTYQVAQQAVSEYTHTMNPNGPIGRFNQIPFQGHLYTPKQFETWYNSLAKQYEKLYPGIDPKSLIPSSSIY